MSHISIHSRARPSRMDFHSLSKHRWDEEVVRLVKASKSAQQRMVEWSPELARHQAPS
jgi:hypothetical protein